MMTVLAVILAILCIFAIASMFSGLIAGDYFAILWFCMGGMEATGHLLALCVQVIAESLNE